MEFGSRFVYLPPGEYEEGDNGTDDDESVMTKIEVQFNKQDDSEGRTCLLDILDTAGQEEFSAMREQYMKASHAFVIVYSITDKQSYQEALDMHTLANRLNEQSKDKVPAILCGNKVDLEDSREVSKDEAEQVAKDRGIAFLETSAKTGVNIREAFETLIRRTPRKSVDYKITILGSGGVGKSAVTVRFTQGIYVDNYDPTIEDSYTVTIVVKDIPDEMIKTPDIPPPPSINLKEKRKKSLKEMLLGKHKGGRKTVSPAAPFGGGVSHRPPLPVSQRTDGNVIMLSLGSLEKEPTILTGDPIKCGSCEAILTHISVVETQENGNKKWKCEFCDHENTNLDLADEEIPKTAEVDFLLEAAPEAETTDAENKFDKLAKTKASTLVYVIDVSSSMGNHSQLPALQAEWYSLRSRGRTSVTRLDCIKQAVQRQLDYYEIETPDKRVALVTFGSLIDVKGAPVESIDTGRIINNMNALMEKGKATAAAMTFKTIQENAVEMKSQVERLSLRGYTALGPALSIAVGMLHDKPGSEIVLCTDGQPNCGIGSLPDQPQFYEQIGEVAKSQQVTISIIGIQTNTEYEMETVSTAAVLTDGNINILNPHELIREFRDMAQDPIVATDVRVVALLHPLLVFENMEREVNNQSRAESNFGNVHKNTDLTFRFKRNAEKSAKPATSLPFQVQVTYKKKDGRRFMRVLSEKQSTTSEFTQMEEHLNMPVIGATAMQECYQMSKYGDVMGARRKLKGYQKVMNNVSGVSASNAESYLAWEKDAIVMDELYDKCQGNDGQFAKVRLQKHAKVSKASYFSNFRKREVVMQKTSKNVTDLQSQYYNIGKEGEQKGGKK